jgi:methyl coenzyme M reductase system, component A2
MPVFVEVKTETRYIECPSKTCQRCPVCGDKLEAFEADFIKLSLYDPSGKILRSA